MLENKTDDFLLSVTEQCATPIKQIQTKPQEKLQFMFTQPREIFASKPPNNISDGSLLIGLASWEV